MLSEIIQCVCLCVFFLKKHLRLQSYAHSLDLYETYFRADIHRAAHLSIHACVLVSSDAISLLWFTFTWGFLFVNFK